MGVVMGVAKFDWVAKFDPCLYVGLAQLDANSGTQVPALRYAIKPLICKTGGRVPNETRRTSKKKVNALLFWEMARSDSIKLPAVSLCNDRHNLA